MIYLLEDDSAIRELVVYTLCSTGLEATGFAAPSEFYDAMERALPELLILDIMLPRTGFPSCAGCAPARARSTCPS